MMHLRSFFCFFLLFAALNLSAQTFNGTGGGIPDDGNSVSFIIPVSGLPNALDTANFGLERVCINVTHQWVSDLHISLITPDGRVLTLVSGLGGDTDGFVNTCLSGNAGASIYQTWYPFTGEFRPFGDMGTLNNGVNPNGNWTLYILDTYPFADTGELLDWSITFGNSPCKPFPFVSSDLPILKINTDGQYIANEPKIDAQLSIIDHGPGQRNFVDDTPTFESRIGIESRGNSSQNMPKRSYNIEIRDETGEDKEVEILQLPKGSDFALAANFSDKTLMRNALAYETFRKMGHYASRTRFCEMVLNNTYQGIYILTEEIRRDSSRVNIAKLKPEDTTGVELTGGYIVRIDWERTPGWRSQFSQPNSPNIYTLFQHTYPRWDELHPSQQQYIRSYIDTFEQRLHGGNYQDPEQGWRPYADESSFIDYLILNELSKNVDGYRLSTYFHKNRDDRGGKLQMGPPWDYDLAWYNADYCDNFNTAGFAFNINYVCQDAGVPFWWERLMQDTLFRQNLSCRWSSLRSSFLSQQQFSATIDSMAGLLSEAQARNFAFWPILGVYVWPNPGAHPDTYAGQVDKMRNWINERANWLDFVFGQAAPDLQAHFDVLSGSGGLDLNFVAQGHPDWSFHWDFGDGVTADGPQAAHQYGQLGTYTIQLTVSTPFGCSASSTQIVHIIDILGAHMPQTNIPFRMYPNPARKTTNVVFPEDLSLQASTLRLLNVLGETVLTRSLSDADHQTVLPLQGIPAGTYAVQWENAAGAIHTAVLIVL